MKDGNVLVQCRFDLTDSEVAAAARKRGTLETDIAKINVAFEVEKEKHKKAVAKLDGEASQLAELIRRGYELRDAECAIQEDYEAGVVNTVRDDTGEIVKTRPMTESEKAKGLPLPLGPSILLSETDPDAYGAKDCTFCGHLRVYHEDNGCIQPDCDCKVFKAEVPEEEADAEDPAACLHCSHPEGVHGTTGERGCMRADCDCKGYVHPDPLGVVDAGPEKREAEL